jgi:hypothetical protein
MTLDPALSTTQGTALLVSIAERFPIIARVSPLLLWALGAEAVFLVGRHLASGGDYGLDAHAYWLAAQSEASHVYDSAPGQRDAFLYSPAFLAVIRPLGVLSWPSFYCAWLGTLTIVLLWLVKPLPVRWAVPLVLLCSPELLNGNIFIFLAASTVLAFRHPSVWAFGALTKVTPGIGLLWSAARGDWREAIRGASAIALIIGLGFVVQPGIWAAWFDFLESNSGGTPDGVIGFAVRSLIAVAIVLIAAPRGIAFLVGPAILLATPVITTIMPLAVLAAVPRLLLIDERPVA